MITRFQPSVSSAELAAVTGPEVMILRLVIIGENIFEVCLSQCLFDFGFPFGQVNRKTTNTFIACLQPGMAVVKKIPLGEKGEKIVVEQAITTTGRVKTFLLLTEPYSDISVSDHGSNLHLATQFGSCDYLMPRFESFYHHHLLAQEEHPRHQAAVLVTNLET